MTTLCSQELTYGRLGGLSETVAAERLKTEGFNELPSAKPRSIFAIAWEVARDACRFGIAPCRWEISLAARYPETTRGIAPYKPMVAVSRCARLRFYRCFGRTEH